MNKRKLIAATILTSLCLSACGQTAEPEIPSSLTEETKEVEEAFAQSAYKEMLSAEELAAVQANGARHEFYLTAEGTYSTDPVESVGILLAENTESSDESEATEEEESASVTESTASKTDKTTASSKTDKTTSSKTDKTTSASTASTASTSETDKTASSAATESTPAASESASQTTQTTTQTTACAHKNNTGISLESRKTPIAGACYNEEVWQYRYCNDCNQYYWNFSYSNSYHHHEYTYDDHWVQEKTCTQDGIYEKGGWSRTACDCGAEPASSQAGTQEVVKSYGHYYDKKVYTDETRRVDDGDGNSHPEMKYQIICSICGDVGSEGWD